MSRLAHERAGDLDHLALGEREPGREVVRIDALDPEPCEHCVGAGAELAPLDESCAAPRGSLPTEQILRDGHPGHQCQLLEDRADAELAARRAGCGSPRRPL